MNTLSVVLATKNEELNIGRCLSAVKNVASEIIVFDECSSDKTTEIAKDFGAKVYQYQPKTNFHETKQKAIDKAAGDWILQLDADEVVTPQLASEIKEVLQMNSEQLNNYLNANQNTAKAKWKLFQRHQRLVAQRENKSWPDGGEVVAFFIPRRNIFLGKPLIHGGVYPDGVIRLFKRGKARLPGKSVHELMEVDGRVSWLINDLDHYDSPTLKRYLDRNKRYVTLIAEDLKKSNLQKNLLNSLDYLFIKPLFEFLSLYFRHKAMLDGYRGFIWSLFSALRFPRAYLRT